MGQPLQFIHYAPDLKSEDFLSAHIARSHTAKVNRQNFAKRHRPKSTTEARGPERAKVSRCTKLNSNGAPDSEASEQLPDGCEQTIIVRAQERSRGALERQLWLQGVAYPLSPVFGGHASEAFDLAKSGPAVAEVAHYGEF